MWCPECQSDVAAEMSADGQTLLCTTCGNEVRKVQAAGLHPETKSARELLERWAHEQRARKEPPEPGSPSGETDPREDAVQESNPRRDGSEIAPRSTADTPEISAETSEDRSSGSKFRIDSAHESPAGPARPEPDPVPRPRHLGKDPVEGDAPREDSAEPADARRQHRIDSLHSAAPEPHFAPQSAGRKLHPGRMESLWGQLLAYAGVGLLTVGTVLVLWGYFGELERYASTGWLISTAGQMLLLLGIVTLVAGGMQQTTFEVTERIEHLGGRIIRIEQSTDELLHGPHFGDKRSRRTHRVASEETDAA